MPHHSLLLVKIATVLKPEMFAYHYKGRWEKKSLNKTDVHLKIKNARHDRGTRPASLGGMNSGLMISCKDIFHNLGNSYEF